MRLGGTIYRVFDFKHIYLLVMGNYISKTILCSIYLQIELNSIIIKTVARVRVPALYISPLRMRAYARTLYSCS